MSEFVSTPISRFTSTTLASSSTDSKENTPRQFTNPFESYLLDRLHTNTYSPSVFAKVDESSERGDFRWSIDHIALLNPADIEISHYHQVAPINSDNETESRYQAVVDKYFAESMVAPSPWSEQNNRTKFVMQASISNDSSFEMQNNLNADASCQTVLTFSPDVDLMQIFGSCFLYKETPEDANISVDMNNSSGNSLRRRLFAGKCSEKRPQGEKVHVESQNCQGGLKPNKAETD